MGQVTLSSGLTLTIPTAGTRNWATLLQTEAWQKISEHDHTGGGKGLQIQTAGIAANAINTSKLRLANNSYLRALNQAGNADVSLIKADTNDNIAFGAFVADANIGAVAPTITMTGNGTIVVSDLVTKYAAISRLGFFCIFDVAITFTLAGAGDTLYIAGIDKTTYGISVHTTERYTGFVYDGAGAIVTHGWRYNTSSQIEVGKLGGGNFGTGTSGMICIQGLLRVNQAGSFP